MSPEAEFSTHELDQTTCNTLCLRHSNLLFSTSEVKLSELVVHLAVRWSPTCSEGGWNLSYVLLKNLRQRRWGDELTTTHVLRHLRLEILITLVLFICIFLTKGQSSNVMCWNENFQVKCQLLGILPLKKMFLLMCFSNVFITAALLPLGRGTARDHRCWGESDGRS